MDDQKSADDDKKKLEREIETLKNRWAVANQALYGGSKTCSDKYSGQKNEGINDGREDFDGTEGSLPAGTPGPVGSDTKVDASDSPEDKTSTGNTNDADQDDSDSQTCYHGPSRKGCTYVKEQVGNRKAGIVIFFYEDIVDKNGKIHTGGRRRAVLKEFLSDAKIKSLQSDGYNVYMYLDDAMYDIEHICCLAHVHNKLQEAKKLGYKIVDFFLAQIKKLYKREKLYASKPNYYTPERIKDARNDEYTDGIVDSMHEKLLDLIAKGEDYFPDKVWRALYYFYNFWDKIFAYRNDGEYSIDNMAVERAIRPLTVQRKNGLFFCSPKGAKNSGIYNTFISTCLQKCRNFRDFFVDYVKAWNQGRRDFTNLVRLAFAPCA